MRTSLHTAVRAQEHSHLGCRRCCGLTYGSQTLYNYKDSI